MSLTPHLTDNDRFNGVKAHYQDRILSRAIKEGRITQLDADQIVAYVAERRITANISVKRAQKIVSSLVTIRRSPLPSPSSTSEHYTPVSNGYRTAYQPEAWISPAIRR